MRILVVEASKHGATREIADRIATRLAEAGHSSHVSAAEGVTTLDDVDAVVVGSALYVGRWLDAARRMCERLSGQLQQRPVWLFSSGPLGDPPKPDEPPADLETLMRLSGAREHRTFSGRLDKGSLGLAKRALTRMVKAPAGDFRQWDEIERWAGAIAAELTAQEQGARR